VGAVSLKITRATTKLKDYLILRHLDSRSIVN
jgi:hypothetical protein